MDRVIVYPGQIPLDTDFLKTQRNKMLGLGFLADTVLGTSVLFDGLACQQTTPASMNVEVLPGTVYVAQPTDSIPFGSLGSDPFRNTVKQGILRNKVTLTLVAPITSGHAVNYLIQAAFSEVEAQPVVLPYYNSANPSQPYSGPENSGVAQYTERRGSLLVSAKAGTSAVSGTQTTPAPDPGYVGLYVITIAYGATSVTSGNITKIPTAPFLPAKLPEIPSGVRDGRWIYAQDVGSANAIVASVTPTPTAYRAGMGIRIKIANANTGPTTVNLNGLGAVALTRADGTPLQENDLYVGMIADILHDGDKFQLANSTGLTALRSIGNGVDIYQGKIGGVHSIRSLVAGANITLTLVESPADSGEYAISIAGPSGGSGGGVSIVNIGSGVQLYKGLNDTDHEFRTIQGEGLLTAALGGTGNNEVRIKMANADGARLLMRSPNSNGAPSFVKISGTTFQTNPNPADKILMERDGTGNLEHTTIEKIRGNAQSLWEIADQFNVVASINEINLIFEIDKYSMLKLILEDLRFETWTSSTIDILEICLMNDATVVVRAPIANTSYTGAIYDVNGVAEWTLSNLNNRAIDMNRLHMMHGQTLGGSGSSPGTQIMSAPEIWHPDFRGEGGPAGSIGRFGLVYVGAGSGTFVPPSASALSLPPNKMRLRHRNFTSLYTDVSTAGNFDSGRATLYGLKRSHAS